MKLLSLVFYFSLVLISSIQAQSYSDYITLVWKERVLSDGNKFNSCYPCSYSVLDGEEYLPYWEKVYGDRNALHEKVSLINPTYTQLEAKDDIFFSQLTSKNSPFNPELKVQNIYERGVARMSVSIPVFRIFQGRLEKLVSFTLLFDKLTTPLADDRFFNIRRTQWPDKSVLSEGYWFVVEVDREGVFRLDRSLLESMGLPVNNLDPRTLKVFSNHGDLLPERNSDPKPGDLLELPILVTGEDDGRLDPSDAVFFYGRPPSKFNVDTLQKDWVFNKHVYATVSRYFITYDGIKGKRMGRLPHMASANVEFIPTYFDDVFRHERDLTNHIKSGRLWYGEHFDRILSYSISHSFPHRLEHYPIKVSTILVARSRQASSFTLQLGGQLQFITIPPLFSLSYETDFIQTPTLRSFDFPNVQGANVTLQISYNKPLATSEGWLDFVEFRAKRRLIHSGGQNRISVMESSQYQSMRLEIQGNENMQIWDVTNPFNPQVQLTEITADKHVFTSQNAGNIPVYYSVTTHLTPKPIGKVNNQNLHGIKDVQYVIIVHPKFKQAADELAQFHAQQNGLSVFVAETPLIFNEFSSGIQDISAIRDFLKMLWDKASEPSKRPQTVLLFGDASYDYLDITPNNTNFVPTYQSTNSHTPNSSFCSDDFFALMDDNEGSLQVNNIGLLDIGIGRIPVGSLSDALHVVKKIKTYYSKDAMGPWRNDFTFAADDMDKPYEGVFVRDSELFTEFIRDRNSASNFSKIYLDAYEQQSLGGAQRYPGAVADINTGIEKGTLVWTYNGHGGQFGLASERVIEIPQINAWNNTHKLPLFMTATCELSRFDDPSMESAGERILLNPSGGGIGLFTTTRLVLVSTNSAISYHFFNSALLGEQGFPDFNRNMGEVNRQTKNKMPTGNGPRNFTYLGDPALRLAVPRYTVILDSLNGKPMNSPQLDTLKALSHVTFTGRVLKPDLSFDQTYNGLVYPIVFDKPNLVQTRLNDKKMSDDSDLWKPIPFLIEKNILFNGRSRVRDGRFSFSFIVPKDINYRFDNSRISLYAENGFEDGRGSASHIMVGGSADSFTLDNQGPAIELYMNDYSFVNGGVTNKNPLFIAKLSDQSGINTTGSGIGREIIATINKGTPEENSITLNEFYQADVDSYQGGEIRYRFSNLRDGEHHITLKAWDVHNNSSEVNLSFLVENDQDLVLRNVLNYPNPFTTNTHFYFDHNKPSRHLTVQLQVMTLGGRVVKSEFAEFPVSDSHVKAFEWNGLDDFGDKLARGVYIYRIRAKTDDSQWAEKYEKLVILN
jgi:hypothetical protein